MKAVVLLSKVFFDGHTHAGQPTNFAQSVKCGNKTHSTEQLSVLEEENSRFARTGRKPLHKAMGG